jgi:glycosyltransferase involved in cell wall biosynthesis
VDRLGVWRDGELIVEDARGGSGPGTVTAYVPDIDGLLPVYVRDEYPGFEVKEFRELSDAELDRYLAVNVAAVRDVAEGGVDAALANHLVMGPVILARAGIEYAVKVHGSALEYTVKRDPQRFLPYAREGVQGAAGVLAGSGHTAESLWTALELPDLPAKTRLGPPGVNTELFAPLARKAADRQLRGLAEQLRASAGGEGPRPGAWGRDPRRAADAVEWFAEGSGLRTVFIGKLIVSKGVDLLLAAWPLVVAANPGARLLIVGFGEYEQGLLRLWEALTTADLEAARGIAARGRGLEGGEEAPLEMLGAFLDAPPAGYAAAAGRAAGSVRFAGRLEHDEVARAVPAAAALVFPSTFPESFGMVAAEAAAAGVLPVSAAHSGLVEVSRELAAALPDGLGELVSFPLGPGAVEGIAERLNAWGATPGESRAPARAALTATVARLWSWEGVARGVLAASAGRLDEVLAIPDSAVIPPPSD